MNQTKSLKWVNLASFIFLLGVSLRFARMGNMFNTEEIMPYFMPASYAFSIWLLIYALLGLWVAWGFFATSEVQVMYESVGYWFALCMILTGLTLIVPTIWSPLFIIGALITSLIVYIKISTSEVSLSFRVPFSFLSAWLSVATIANISLVLKMIGITEPLGISEIGWTILLLAFSAILAIVVTIYRVDRIYSLVFIWGYIAIAIQNSGTPSIVRMCLMMCVVLLAAIAYTLYPFKIQDHSDN